VKVWSKRSCENVDIVMGECRCSSGGSTILTVRGASRRCVGGEVVVVVVGRIAVSVLESE
jgi:hypothetical protein